MNETFRSLRVRNFRLFFSGQLISQTGNWLTMVAQALLVLELTDSGVALGLLAAAQFGPVLLLGPFAGLVADRSDKRRLLLWVQVGAMAQSFALGALAALDHPPIAALYVIAVMGGIATAFDNPARRSFVVELVPDDHVNNAVSLHSAIMTSARIVGPALAGLLVTTAGFAWCFVLDGATYLAVLYGYWRMDTSLIRRAPAAPRGKGQIREGLRYTRSVPDLWLPLVMMAVIGTLAFNFSTVLPLFATRDLGGSDLTFTLLMSATSCGSLVGALRTARRPSVDLRFVCISAFGFGVTMTLLAMAPNEPLAFVVAPLMGFSSIAWMTASTALVQLAATPTMRGRVLALQAMVFLGSTPIGGPIVGAVSERFSARWGLGVGAAATLVAAVCGLAALRRIASRPRPTDAVAVEVAVEEAVAR